MPELTAELIVDRIIPSDPQVSPDGRFVIWTAEPASRRDEHGTSEVWLAPVAPPSPPLPLGEGRGEGARPLTAGPWRSFHPRWAPDGGAVYFLSDRAEPGTAQLYRLLMSGGEARPLTAGKAGVETFAVSPAGTRVAFARPDDTGAEDERRKSERDDAEVWGERWRRCRLWLLDPDTLRGEPIDLGETHVAGLAWSPDGRWVAAATWPTPQINDGWHGADLWLAPADGVGAPRHLGRHPAMARTLCFARSGHDLLFLGPEAGCEPSSDGVWSLALVGGTARCLTTGLPACVQSLTRPEQATRFVVELAEGVTTRLAWLDPASGRLDPFPLALDGLIAAPSFSADGRTLALIRSAAHAPPEIWAGVGGQGPDVGAVSLDPTPDPQPLAPLSDHGAPFRGVEWGQQAVVTWAAPDGWTIDGLLVTPPGHPGDSGGGRLPLICYVHGGPYGRWADGFNVTWAQWLAAHGWAVLMPNPRGGRGHGHRFAATVAGEVGMADYHGVMAGVDALIERGVADPDRLGIGGWSQGGFMTAWAVGQTDRFKAGVMGAGVSDWGMMVAESDMTDFELMLGGDAPWDGPGARRHDHLSPISYARHVRTPLLILHGEKDERVPVSQGRLMGLALRRLGVPVEEVIYPREPHGIRERNHQLDLHRRIVAWYRRWLG